MTSEPKQLIARLFVGQSNIAPASFRKWNLALAGLNFIQGFAFLILGPARDFPITTTFLTTDTLQTSVTAHMIAAPSVRQLFVVNLSYFLVTIFFVSAFWHLLMATFLLKRYEYGLKSNASKLRWAGQAFSLSSMIFVISLLGGVYDFSTLLIFFVLISMASFLNFVRESQVRSGNKGGAIAFFVGSCVAGIVPWVVVAFYLIGAQIYGGGLASISAYWIFASAFILLAGFVVNAYLQYMRYGKWVAYTYSERWHMILGFIAKTIIAWQVFAAVLHS